MACISCGTPILEGVAFCPTCGTPVDAGIQGGHQPSGVPPAPMASPGAEPPAAGGSRKPGFFSSPGGVVLIVLIALLVVGGIATGVVLLVVSGSGRGADDATMLVWEEYLHQLEKDSEELSQGHYDLESLSGNLDYVIKARGNVLALEDRLQQTAGSRERQEDPAIESTSIQDRRVEELSDALFDYDAYLLKLEALFTHLMAAISGGHLHDAETVNVINQLFAQAQDLSSEAAESSEIFRLDNDQAEGWFDPNILGLAWDMVPSFEQTVATAQETEHQRLEAERIAAEEAGAAASQPASNWFLMTDWDGSPFFCSHCGSRWGVMRDIGYGPARFCAICGGPLHN